ncbi:MAG: DUF5057 domain-containing protein [Bacteroidales bacterium]|nr:DUF5057 domain-containing protein [Clostridium sp.]MCM1202609.1 DUF5057 domain-containing protein [Bacteroidales bacterium]
MSKKKIIAIICTLVVFVISVSAISYSIATRGVPSEDNMPEIGSEPTNRSAGINSDYKTNIDLIIENSNKSGEEAQTFNIVEIVPVGTSGSELKQYIENGHFKTNVFDANSTKGATMKEDMILLDTITVSAATTLNDKMNSNITGENSTLSDILNKADLIYLSSPSYTAYDNNMSEDVYNYLHTYALGKDKPIIIDYVKPGDNGNSAAAKTYKDLVGEIRTNHIRFRTFAWSSDANATEFFSASMAKKSYYIKYNTNQTAYNGKVLVVTTNKDEQGSMYQKMIGTDTNTLINTAYYGTSKPQELEYTFVNPTALTVEQLNDSYDFILLENNIMTASMSNEVFQKLKALSEACRYILYDFRGSFNDDTSSYVATNNYVKLMNLVLTANGIAKQSNILSVRYGFFTSLNNAGDDGVASAKAIADIINTSEYRDSSSSGENGSAYRVLEIQPCYPIDTELAVRNGGSGSKYPAYKGMYYTVPDQVLSGVTKDEIEDDVEYYAFEISKAKIAHATGIPYNQIEVDQVSVNELISTKDVVLESYDLVYIGGDTSAYVEAPYVNYGGGDWNWQNNYVQSALKYLTQFDMYTHTGNFVDYFSNAYGSIAGGSNSVEFGGHDLSTIKRDELKDFVDSGLPIIIDKTVTDAFEESYQHDPSNEKSTDKNRLAQLGLKQIDPDCNMYQFLAYTYEKLQAGTTSGNVAWGVANAAAATAQVENVGNEYGYTLGGQVTVYNDDYENTIRNLVENAAVRPSLRLTNKPKDYVEGDSSTVNTESSVKFTAGVVTTAADTASYTVELFVDANGDCNYAETELVDSKNCSAGGSVDLSYALDDDFFGLVNWKVKVTAANGVLCDTKKGTALFKLDSEMKKTVKVLQIMPLEENEQTGFSSGFSLYFCTECQQAMQELDNNVLVIGNDKNGNPGLNSFADQEKVLGNVTVGKHEHKFGIVKYDSTIATDDWESNFADTLTHGEDGTLETGDYEFELDIVTPSEFDKMCADAVARTDTQIDAEAILADQYLTEYEEGLEAQTLITYRGRLETELYKAADQIRGTNSGRRRSVILDGIGTALSPGDWMIDGEYYKFWEYCNDRGNQDLVNALDLTALKSAYNDYITEYDKLVEKKELYKEHSRKAGDKDNWLYNNYSIVVLGLADDFNYKDLSTVSCEQIKTYIGKGGSVLNTHDTMSKSSVTGAVNLTNSLRSTFGMDRFHVEDYGTSTKVELRVPKTGSKTVRISPDGWMSQYYQGGRDFTVTNKDLLIQVNGNDINGATVTEGAEHTSLDEKVKITVVSSVPGTVFQYYDMSTSWNANDKVQSGGSFEVEQSVEYSAKATFNLGKEYNVLVDYDISTGDLTATSGVVSAEDGIIQVKVTVVDGTEEVPNGTAIQCVYRGRTQTTRTIDGGVALFYLDPNQAASGSIYDQPAGGSKYRRYDTEDNSKYFWTERMQALSPEDYAGIASKLEGITIKYNAPVGVTDMFAFYDSSSRPTSPYRYVMMADEAFNHKGTDLDGSSFEAKYGTRKATKVNQGGVTMYPFAISSELLISPTHSQMFALDLEDPTVAVWYTLAANFVSSSPDVSAYFARYDSGLYAASPKDGMNNYFLYSKNNVFYCGAGHQKVTGNMKDNNDERRLFINVIVNSVSKGKSKPKLKLYNKCDEKGNNHENCEDLYVDPKDEEGNKLLAKEFNTLYYNDSIEMYQYNVDELQTNFYPEFDFKAIAGTADIKEIVVFYDLNYGEGDGKDTSDIYKADANHVLITSYDKDDQMSGKRVRLRESAFPKLLLKDSYYNNYNGNYTYIVIRVKDELNQWQSARVKINKIPKLFDLTDAGFDAVAQGQTGSSFMLDATDRRQFNI